MRIFTTGQVIRLFSFTLLAVTLGLVQAQAKTDLSGTWKVNAGKSDFDPCRRPTA